MTTALAWFAFVAFVVGGVAHNSWLIAASVVLAILVLRRADEVDRMYED